MKEPTFEIRETREERLEIREAGFALPILQLIRKNGEILWWAPDQRGEGLDTLRLFQSAINEAIRRAEAHDESH